MTSGCPKPQEAACRIGSLLWDFFFIPFSPTGISRWECMRQGMVKKLCGQSNSANADSKVIATLLGDSSDFFLLGIRYLVLSQTALELSCFLHYPTTENMAEQRSKKHPENSLGRECQSRCKESLRKIIGFLLDQKKKPKSDFSPPSILWSATTTEESKREAGGLTASCTCCKSLVQHPCCVMISSCDLGQVTHLCGDSLKHGQLYRPAAQWGHVVKMWNSRTLEQLLSEGLTSVNYTLSLEMRLPNVYRVSVGSCRVFFADYNKLYNFLLVYKDTCVK